MFLQGEAVGHAGQVIGDGPGHAVARRPARGTSPAVCGVGRQSVEHLAQCLLGRAALRQNVRMSINSVEQKPFQPAFSIPPARPTGRDDDAGLAARRPPLAMRLGSAVRVRRRSANRSPANRSTRGRSPGASCRSSKLANRPATRSLALAPQRHFEQFAQLQQAEFQRIVGVVRVVGDAVGRVDDLHLQQRAVPRSRGRRLVLPRCACPSSTSRVRFRPGKLADSEFPAARRSAAPGRCD